MNENLDLTKILDGCPMWTKFYSTIHDEISFKRIELSKDYPIIFDSDAIVGEVILTEKGMALRGVGECIVFPSKDQRDWSKFVRFWDKPKVEKFDPKTLLPYDKVLVWKDLDSIWMPTIFTFLDFSLEYPRMRYSSLAAKVIPYNNDTKHLVGTRDEAPEYYRYWEE